MDTSPPDPMFAARDCSATVHGLREEVLADGLVVDCAREFDVLSEDLLYELALFTDDVDPIPYPDDWIPDDAPDPIARLAGADPVVGRPGQGSVTWTRQFDPSLVIVKPRGRELPDRFLDFRLAEAILVCSLDVPEHPLGFFRGRYPVLQATVGDPDAAMRLASALYEAWIGLTVRPRFEAWAEDHPTLHEGWKEAGRLLADRVAELPALRADGSIDFLEATDLACSAVKHGYDLPAPFGALGVNAYRTEGATYALRWLERTVASLGD